MIKNEKVINLGLGLMTGQVTKMLQGCLVRNDKKFYATRNGSRKSIAQKCTNTHGLFMVLVKKWWLLWEKFEIAWKLEVTWVITQRGWILINDLYYLDLRIWENLRLNWKVWTMEGAMAAQSNIHGLRKARQITGSLVSQSKWMVIGSIKTWQREACLLLYKI